MDFNPEDKTVVGLSFGQKVFGRYDLEKVLGQGAMGVVWLATDTVMHEPVALKFLPQVLAVDPVALDEMKQEARQSRRLTHENIVRIHDIVTDGSMAAISMEWVDGFTLSALRLKKPKRILGVEDLTPLIPQMALGLDYAHQRGKVVHRDLKPSNLMVSREGDLKITDFGIARSLTDTVTRLTKASTSGTPCYMSPQQMMGKRPDPKDDIYALGATLYELLTGKPPFYTGDLGMQILHADVVSVSERRDELGLDAEPIPDSWESALKQCLCKDPEKRFANAAELVSALGLEDVSVQPLSGYAGGDSSAGGQPETFRPTQGSHRGAQEQACPHCGQAVYPDQQFCRHCGGPLTEPCPECEYPNPLNTRFCGKCGVDQTAFQELRRVVDAAEEAWKQQQLEKLAGIEDPESQFSILQGTRSKALKSRLKELSHEAEAPEPAEAALVNHIRDLVKEEKFKDAQTLMLSPSLAESDRARIRKEISKTISKLHEETAEQVRQWIEEDQLSRALEHYQQFVNHYPAEFQPEEARNLLQALKGLGSIASLAEAGELDALKQEQEKLAALSLPSPFQGLVSRKSSELAWNGVLAQAQQRLKANEPAEAYRILSAFEQSGLGDERIGTLRPRMEAIRQEANRSLEGELKALENRVEAGENTPAGLSEDIRRLKVKYLAEPEGAEPDAIRRRLDALEFQENPPETAEASEPPPLPEQVFSRPLPDEKPPPIPDPAPPENASPTPAVQPKGPEKQMEEPSSVSSTPPRKTRPKKSSKGLVLGLLFGVATPLLLGVVFLVFFLPYQDGKEVLNYVDTLMADGAYDDAGLELNWLEDTPMRSLFLKDAIKERRALLESDQVLRDYLTSIPGLKESFQNFRKEFPQGRVEEFTGSWDSLQGFIDSVRPGTVIVLRNQDYAAFRGIDISKGIGLIGGGEGTTLTVKPGGGARVLISAREADLLLANLTFNYEPTEHDEELFISVAGGRFRFHRLMFSGGTQGISITNSRGKIVDTNLSNMRATAISVSGSASEVDLESILIEESNIGVSLDEQASLRMQDGEIYGGIIAGIQLTGASKVNLTKCSVDLNGVGMRLEGGSEATVELSTFDFNENFGIEVTGLNSRLDFRDSQSNENVDGLFIFKGSATLSDSDFLGNEFYGIQLGDEVASIQITNCNASENGFAGLRNEGSSELLVVNSNFERNTRSGVTILGTGPRGLFRNCLMHQNESEGLSLEGRVEVTLEASTLSENKKSGITSTQGSKATLTGCVVSQNEENGIQVSQGAYLSLRKTEIIENAKSGISLNDAGTLGELTNASVLRNVRHGIYFGEKSSGWVEESRIDQNGEAGILAGNSGTRVRLIGNTVTRNQYGIVLQTGASGEILDNESSENTNSGIGIYSDNTEALISNNILKQNSGYGLDVSGVNKVTILQKNTYLENTKGAENR